MNDYDEMEGPLSEEQVIDEFMGEHPRARELALMREALESRLAMFQKELQSATGDTERAHLQSRIKEVEQQIAVLEQEEAITTFVENSVRVTLHKPSDEWD